MANQEHVEILMQGVEVWNTWRKDQEHGREDYEVPAIEPDLSEAHLEETNRI